MKAARAPSIGVTSIVYIVFAVGCFAVLHVSPEIALALLLSYAYSLLPMAFWRAPSEPSSHELCDSLVARRFDKLLLLSSALFVFFTVLKFYTRDYEVSFNPVGNRDQMIAYAREPIDYAIGAVSNLSYGLVFAFVMLANYYKIRMSRKALALILVASAIFIWASASRLALIFAIGYFLAIGWRPSFDRKTLIFGALTIAFVLFIFVLRAERSSVDTSILFLTYVSNWGLANVIDVTLADSDIVNVVLLSIAYVVHSFVILVEVTKDVWGGVNASFGGTFSLLMGMFGLSLSSDALSPYSGLMHTELGFFINEIGFVGALAILILKIAWAAAPTARLWSTYTRLLIPLSAFCSPFTSAINFAVLPQFVAAIFFATCLGFLLKKPKKGWAKVRPRAAG